MDDAPRSTSIPVRMLNTDQVAHYANHISVETTQGAVLIEFAQILHPVPGDESAFEHLRSTGLTGHLLSRVLVPHQIFEDFIRNMAAQLDEQDS